MGSHSNCARNPENPRQKHLEKSDKCTCFIFSSLRSFCIGYSSSGSSTNMSAYKRPRYVGNRSAARVCMFSIAQPRHHCSDDGAQRLGLQAFCAQATADIQIQAQSTAALRQTVAGARSSGMYGLNKWPELVQARCPHLPGSSAAATPYQQSSGSSHLLQWQCAHAAGCSAAVAAVPASARCPWRLAWRLTAFCPCAACAWPLARPR